jgi:hypothetical protein
MAAAWLAGFPGLGAANRVLAAESSEVRVAHAFAAAWNARDVAGVVALMSDDAHLAQIERHNPALNAVVTLDAERARTRAASGSTTPGSAWFSAQRPERRAA